MLQDRNFYADSSNLGVLLFAYFSCENQEYLIMSSLSPSAPLFLFCGSNLGPSHPRQELCLHSQPWQLVCVLL